MSFEKKSLLESLTAMPVGRTSPHASRVLLRHISAKSGYRSISPEEVKGKRPPKRTKRLMASASFCASIYSANSFGSVLGNSAMARLRCAAVPAFTMSDLPCCSNHFLSSTLILSHGGLPHMASKPPWANTSGNSTLQWKKRYRPAAACTSALKSSESLGPS